MNQPPLCSLHHNVYFTRACALFQPVTVTMLRMKTLQKAEVTDGLSEYSLGSKETSAAGTFFYPACALFLRSPLVRLCFIPGDVKKNSTDAC